jgi:hypothetical protein
MLQLSKHRKEENNGSAIVADLISIRNTVNLSLTARKEISSSS